VYVILETLYAAVFLNLCAFLIVAVCLRGDAAGGKIENGHYYLGDHGKYSEVSQHVFEYSRLHGRITGYSFAAAFVLGLLAYRGRGHTSNVGKSKKSAVP
jgi:hypothetical protein